MAAHVRKLDDDHTTWTQTLDDVEADLTTVSGVTLYVEAPDGTTAVSGASVTVVDADTVSYTFSASDLSQTGGHNAEFHIAYSDSTTEISPKDGYYGVRVVQNLN
ncbi:hypothetical protein [Haloarcula sp. 1CSR25-25]|uniref:hypothetical protein n=1 Tax=Haloarcula sp. 1CSR25-25 TaxID=2862545 RepID=UPI0028953874|nr:hypothetical protein [Haloarcula sp. 1CSR25-25]MDT3434691.1 hypothetical protein [Haloarcula sp. 1CSR25-25]